MGTEGVESTMNIVVGITGGISAYKACDLILGLKKNGHEVRVIMTENAHNFITAMSLSVLSEHPVMESMWVERQGTIDHIEVAKWADAFIVYPATANIIAKFTHGIADDLLSTVYLALPYRKDGVGVSRHIFPAMNTVMYNHKSVQRNIDELDAQEYTCVYETRETMLACGDFGKGGLMNPRDAVETILKGE